MQSKWRSEVPQLIVVAGMFAVAAALWPFAPVEFPMHWNLQGNVDRFGGRLEGLFLLPCITAALYVLLLVLPKFDPARANHESFRPVLLVIRWLILAVFAGMYASLLLTAWGHNVNLRSTAPMALGLLFVILGNFMGKIRPNWFVGVRTPWTLSSRRSWNKTHRLAGWLFVAMDVAIGACWVVHTNWMAAVAAAVVVGSLIWMTVYSYFQWRDDPERLSPAAIVPAPDRVELK